MRYGEELYFSEVDGRTDVLCFKPNVDRIINDAWYKDKNCDPAKESERIVRTAAKLISNDMKAAVSFIPLKMKSAARSSE